MEMRRIAGWGFALMVGMAVGLAGCKSNPQAAQVVDANNGPDPAAANFAPVDPNAAAPAAVPAAPTRVLSSRASAPTYSQSEQTGGYGTSYPPEDSQYDAQYQTEQEPVAEYAPQPPPPLPTYEQPELTEEGYLWTPGYWAYGSGGYYWVPGAWVAPPYQGALWTPGYWGSDHGRYGFHRGYWARHIGFYGGINYGFGYVGTGYEGGYWGGNQFHYNNHVNRVDINVVHNVYERNVTVVNNTRVSFNGPQGVAARPQPAEVAVLREQRTPPMQVQQQRVQAAQQNRAQFYAENHGKPAVVVAPERVPADRTPPEAIRPNPGVQGAAPQRGGFGQQAATQNQQQQEQQRANQQRDAQAQQQQQQREQQQQRDAQAQQARQNQLQQSQRSQVAQQQQRQAEQQQQQKQEQQQQRHDQQRPVAPSPAPRPEQRAPQPQPQQRLAPPQPRQEPQARPTPEQRPAAPARPAPEQRPAPRPEAPRPAPENHPERPPVA